MAERASAKTKKKSEKKMMQECRGKEAINCTQALSELK